MVTTDLEQAIQDSQATEVSSHTNGLVSSLHLYCSTQHFHFQIPELHFFFLKKGINTCGSQQGLKNETSQHEKKNGPHSRGPIPNAPKLTFLSLTGVNVPASTSKDARLLCPKLLENKPLNDQLELPLHNTPRQTEQSWDTDSLWWQNYWPLIHFSMLAESYHSLSRMGLALTALGITWEGPDDLAASVFESQEPGLSQAITS